MLSGKRLLDLCGQYERILVLRHIRPDYDALGAQAGTVRFLKSRFPEKDIRAGGSYPSLKNSFLPDPERMDPQWAEGALAILCDTSTLDRIDGKDLYERAGHVVILDHHHGTIPPIEDEIVDISSSSCSEICALLFRQAQQGKLLEKSAAEALYAGIIADSLQFSIRTTTSRTLEIASWLVQSGLDVNSINRKVFAVPMDTYRYCSHLREIANYDTPHLAYAVLEPGDYEPYHISWENAKRKVTVFGEIEGIRAWALIAHEPDGTYSASLRSHSLMIRDIAERFGGGGHDCASGISGMHAPQVGELIGMLKKRVQEG